MVSSLRLREQLGEAGIIKTWKLGERPVGLAPSTTACTGAGRSEGRCNEIVFISAAKAPKLIQLLSLSLCLLDSGYFYSLFIKIQIYSHGLLHPASSPTQQTLPRLENLGAH